MYDPIAEILPSRIQSYKQHCPKCNVQMLVSDGVLMNNETNFEQLNFKLSEKQLEDLENYQMQWVM